MIIGEKSPGGSTRSRPRPDRRVSRKSGFRESAAIGLARTWPAKELRSIGRSTWHWADLPKANSITAVDGEHRQAARAPRCRAQIPDANRRGPAGRDHARSKRSRFITLLHAATN